MMNESEDIVRAILVSLSFALFAIACVMVAGKIFGWN